MIDYMLVMCPFKYRIQKTKQCVSLILWLHIYRESSINNFVYCTTNLNKLETTKLLKQINILGLSNMRKTCLSIYPHARLNVGLIKIFEISSHLIDKGHPKIT